TDLGHNGSLIAFPPALGSTHFILDTRPQHGYVRDTIRRCRQCLLETVSKHPSKIQHRSYTINCVGVSKCYTRAGNPLSSLALCNQGDTRGFVQINCCLYIYVLDNHLSWRRLKIVLLRVAVVRNDAATSPIPTARHRHPVRTTAHILRLGNFSPDIPNQHAQPKSVRLRRGAAVQPYNRPYRTIPHVAGCAPVITRA